MKPALEPGSLWTVVKGQKVPHGVMGRVAKTGEGRYGPWVLLRTAFTPKGLYFTEDSFFTNPRNLAPVTEDYGQRIGALTQEDLEAHAKASWAIKKIQELKDTGEDPTRVLDWATQNLSKPAWNKVLEAHPEFS